MDAGSVGHQPPPGLGQTELRVFGGYDEIATQHQFESTADRIAIDRSYQRFPAVCAALETQCFGIEYRSAIERSDFLALLIVRYETYFPLIVLTV